MPLTSFTPSYGTSFAGLRPSAVNAGVAAAGTGTVALKPLLLPQGAGAMRDNPLPMGKGRSKRLLALSGLFALIGLAFALRYRPAIPNNYTTGASGTEAAGAQEDVVAMPLDESSVVDPVAGDVLDVIEVDTFEPPPPVVELPLPLPPVNRTTFGGIPTPTVDEEAVPGDVNHAIYGAAACATLVAGIGVLCKARNHNKSSESARSPRQRRRADSCHRCGTPFKASQGNALFSHESNGRLNVVGDGRVMTQESPPRGTRPLVRPGTPHPKRKHSKGASDDDDGDTVTAFAIAPPPVSRSSASPSENVVSRPNPSGNRRGTAIAALFSGLVIVGCATANHQRAQRARTSASGPTSPKPKPKKPKAEEPKEPEPRVSSEDVKCDFDILAMLRESAARTGTYSVILPAPPSTFASPPCQPPAPPPAFATNPIISSPPLAAASVSAPLTFLTTGAGGGGLDWKTCYLHLLCGLVCFFVLSFLPLPERFTGETVAMQMEEAERRRREAEKEEEEEGKKEREKEKAEKAEKEQEKEKGDSAKEKAETETVGDTSDSFIAPQSPSPASSSSGAKAIKPLPLPDPNPSELPLDIKPTTPCIPSNPCIPCNPSAEPTTDIKLKFKTPTNMSIEEPLFETPVETFCTSDPGRASSSSDDSEGTLRTIALDVVEGCPKGDVAVKAKVNEEVNSNVEGRAEEVTKAEVNIHEARGSVEKRAEEEEKAKPEHLVESRMEVIVDASYNMSDYLPPPSPENSCEVVEPILSVVPLAVEKVDECKPKVEGPFEFLPVPRRVERKSATLEIIYEWACDLELGVYIDVPSEEFKSFETITLTHDNLNPRYIFELGIPPEVKANFPSTLTGNEKPKEWYTTISGTPRLLESSTPIQRRSMKTARPTVTTSSVAVTAPSASSGMSAPPRIPKSAAERKASIDRMLEERARARRAAAHPAQNDANTRTDSTTSTMSRARARLVPSSASILLARRTLTPAERNEMDVTLLRASRKSKGKEKAEEGQTTPKACTSAAAPTDRARGADATPIQRTPLASAVSVVRSSAEKRATVDRLLAERRARRAAEAASSSGSSSSAPTTYAASTTASSSALASSSTPPATFSTQKASMLSSSAPPPSFALPSSARASTAKRRGLSSSSWAPRSSAPPLSAARSSLLSSSAPPSSAPSASISSFSARSSSVPPNLIPFPVPQGATIAERTAARRLIREARLASLPSEDRLPSTAERAKLTEVTHAKEVHQQAPAQEVQRDVEQVGRDVERQHRPRSLPPKKNDWEVKEALDDAASLYARRERERQRLARIAEDSAKEARVREHRPRSQRVEGAGAKEQRQRTEEFKVDEVKAAREREHRPRSQRAEGSTTTATARTTTNTTITAATMYTSTTTARASPKRPSTSVKRVDSTPMPKVEDDLFSESGTPGVPVRPFKTPPRVTWPRRAFV